jgi:hypothetical protein
VRRSIHRVRRRGWSLAVAGVVAVAALAGPSTARPAAADEHLIEVPTESFCRSAPAASPFVDVGPDAVFGRFIRCLAHARVTNGTASGTRYHPDRAVTRGQMATFATRLIDVSQVLAVDEGVLVALPPFEGRGAFADVPRTHVHWGSVHRLRAAGLTSGNGGISAAAGAPRFGPDVAVTRAQMASLIVRSLEYLVGEELEAGETGYFSDVGPGPHQPAIDFLGELGIVIGDRRERFRPDEAVSRGQLAAVLVRSLAVLQLSDLIDPPGT